MSLIIWHLQVTDFLGRQWQVYTFESNMRTYINKSDIDWMFMWLNISEGDFKVSQLFCTVKLISQNVKTIHGNIKLREALVQVECIYAQKYVNSKISQGTLIDNKTETLHGNMHSY